MRIRHAFWVPAVVGFAADLISKHFVFAALKDAPDHSRELLGTWFLFRLQMNPRGVFGLGPGKAYVYVALSLVALGVVFWMLRSTKPEQRLMTVALGLVVAGALGNLHDRLRYGAVRDFIYLYAAPLGVGWPAFNLADACICVAAGLLVLEILRQGEDEEKGKSAKARK